MANNGISFKMNVIDKRGLLKKATDEGIVGALEAAGLQAVGYVKDKIRDNGSIDTGLMRNSIAYAVSGKVPSIGATNKKARTYKADRPKDGETEIIQGTYTKQAPKTAKDSYKVCYIGTAVEYAKDVDKGTINQQAKPFLEPAITTHRAELKSIVEAELKKSIKNAK